MSFVKELTITVNMTAAFSQSEQSPVVFLVIRIRLKMTQPLLYTPNQLSIASMDFSDYMRLALGTKSCQTYIMHVCSGYGEILST